MKSGIHISADCNVVAIHHDQLTPLLASELLIATEHELAYELVCWDGHRWMKSCPSLVESCRCRTLCRVDVRGNDAISSFQAHEVLCHPQQKILLREGRVLAAQTLAPGDWLHTFHNTDAAALLGQQAVDASPAQDLQIREVQRLGEAMHCVRIVLPSSMSVLTETSICLYGG